MEDTSRNDKGLQKYKNQIVYSVPSQFINTFSYTLITLSITTLFTPTEVGYYSVSVKILGIPLALISSNISKVYLQKMSEFKRNGISFVSTFKKILVFLTILSISGFGILTFIAPVGAEIFFG